MDSPQLDPIDVLPQFMPEEAPINIHLICHYQQYTIHAATFPIPGQPCSGIPWIPDWQWSPWWLAANTCDHPAACILHGRLPNLVGNQQPAPASYICPPQVEGPSCISGGSYIGGWEAHQHYGHCHGFWCHCWRAAPWATVPCVGAACSNFWSSQWYSSCNGEWGSCPAPTDARLYPQFWACAGAAEMVFIPLEFCCPVIGRHLKPVQFWLKVCQLVINAGKEVVAMLITLTPQKKNWNITLSLCASSVFVEILTWSSCCTIYTILPRKSSVWCSDSHFQWGMATSDPNFHKDIDTKHSYWYSSLACLSMPLCDKTLMHWQQHCSTFCTGTSILALSCMWFMNVVHYFLNSSKICVYVKLLNFILLAGWWDHEGTSTVPLVRPLSENMKSVGVRN